MTIWMNDAFLLVEVVAVFPSIIIFYSNTVMCDNPADMPWTTSKWRGQEVEKNDYWRSRLQWGLYLWYCGRRACILRPVGVVCGRFAPFWTSLLPVGVVCGGFAAGVNRPAVDRHVWTYTVWASNLKFELRCLHVLIWYYRHIFLVLNFSFFRRHTQFHAI